MSTYVWSGLQGKYLVLLIINLYRPYKKKINACVANPNWWKSVRSFFSHTHTVSYFSSSNIKTEEKPSSPWALWGTSACWSESSLSYTVILRYARLPYEHYYIKKLYRFSLLSRNYRCQRFLLVHQGHVLLLSGEQRALSNMLLYSFSQIPLRNVNLKHSSTSLLTKKIIINK